MAAEAEAAAAWAEAEQQRTATEEEARMSPIERRQLRAIKKKEAKEQKKELKLLQKENKRRVKLGVYSCGASMSRTAGDAPCHSWLYWLCCVVVTGQPPLADPISLRADLPAADGLSPLERRRERKVLGNDANTVGQAVGKAEQAQKAEWLERSARLRAEGRVAELEVELAIARASREAEEAELHEVRVELLTAHAQINASAWEEGDAGGESSGSLVSLGGPEGRSQFSAAGSPLALVPYGSQPEHSGYGSGYGSTHTQRSPLPPEAVLSEASVRQSLFDADRHGTLSLSRRQQDAEERMAQAETVEGCLRRERALRAELAAERSQQQQQRRQRQRQEEGGRSRSFGDATVAVSGHHDAHSPAGWPQQWRGVDPVEEELRHVTSELSHLQGLYVQSVADAREQKRQLDEVKVSLRRPPHTEPIHVDAGRQQAGMPRDRLVGGMPRAGEQFDRWARPSSQQDHTWQGQAGHVWSPGQEERQATVEMGSPAQMQRPHAYEKRAPSWHQHYQHVGITNFTRDVGDATLHTDEAPSTSAHGPSFAVGPVDLSLDSWNALSQRLHAPVATLSIGEPPPHVFGRQQMVSTIDELSGQQPHEYQHHLRRVVAPATQQPLNVGQRPPDARDPSNGDHSWDDKIAAQQAWRAARHTGGGGSGSAGMGTDRATDIHRSDWGRQLQFHQDGHSRTGP